MCCQAWLLKYYIGFSGAQYTKGCIGALYCIEHIIFCQCLLLKYIVEFSDAHYTVTRHYC